MKNESGYFTGFVQGYFVTEINRYALNALAMNDTDE